MFLLQVFLRRAFMFSCPYCDSENVSLEPFNTHSHSFSFFIKLLKKINIDLSEVKSYPANKRVPHGRYIIRCNDCKKFTIIYVG
jgi:predicted RNA-binding Zn-ribbon protein involved in translation (DUF1610 family)